MKRCNIIEVIIYLKRSRFWLYLSNQLHDEVHHQLGVLVEHSLPQLVHDSLGEVEDVVDQDLITAAGAERQRGVFTWTETHRRAYLSSLPFWPENYISFTPFSPPSSRISIFP